MPPPTGPPPCRWQGLREGGWRRALALWGGNVTAFLLHLHDDGGRGQDKASAGHQRRGERIAKRQADERQEGHGEEDLRQPQPEDGTPHGP